MLPYTTLIEIDRHAEMPVFLQIANAFMFHIKKGIFQAGMKLPGSRMLAEMLGVHRKTAIAAFEELAAQGWIEQIPSKGTFISSRLPEIKPVALEKNPVLYPKKTGYPVRKNIILAVPVLKSGKMSGFDDGFPDVRLAPLDALARNYRNIMKRGFQQHLLGYSETGGNPFLKEMLADFLQKSRGLALQPENIFITRGSVMGISLTAQVLLEKKDTVLVGETNYLAATMIFRNIGTELIKIPVDSQGICVDEVEKICQKQTVRMLYITPHHHYPTTVTLSAERRIRLLQLAEIHGFAILEDDYDYDFHYASSPILPLASADRQGMVIYVGSFCKTLAPAIRVGYVVAPANVIEELGYLRRITDRQGDNVLEQAVAELFAEGIMQSHLKKSQKIYHQRRDFFCQLLHSEFKDLIDFQIPDGGMAVWAKFHENINLPELEKKAALHNFYLNNGLFYNPENKFLNATRLGFASNTVEETEKNLELLILLIKKSQNR